MRDSRIDSDGKVNLESPNVALLSCELCSRRKIRCDKRQPCSACVKANKECTPVVRPRLPRGRRGGRKEANTKLRARVRRLEDLVQSLSGSATSPPKTVGHSPVSPSDTQNTTIAGRGEVSTQRNSLSGTSPSCINNNDISRLLGSTVWTQLSNELNGLRSVLENNDEDDIGEINSPTNSSSRDENSSSIESPFSFGNYGMPPQDNMSSQSVKDIMTIYSYHIDPVMKVLHLPTLQQSLEQGSDYLGHAVNSSTFEALRAAIFYASFSSLNDAQCLDSFGEKKEIIRGRWQAVTEYWLQKADMIIHQNITILQALLIYIAAVRSHDSGVRSWTLMALAVRIAHGLQLHREEAYGALTFFQAQIHRRTWFGLLGLDFQASFDRGTDPGVHANGYNTKIPLNLNDADFDYHTPMTWSERSDITEMVFMNVAAEAQALVRQLSFVPPGDYDQPPTLMQCSWEARQKAVTDFEQYYTCKYLQKLDTSVPIQFASMNLGQVVLSAMQLYVVRPLQRHPAANPPPPGAVNVLLRATETLERKEMFKNAVTSPWHWLFAGYVDWHPLATLLAELCAPQSDLELVERAWRTAGVAFTAVEAMIAEGTSGGLWRSLRKLMKMAQRRRALDQPQLQPGPGALLVPDSGMNLPVNSTGLDSSMNVLDTALPPDYGFGMDPMDDSWMNWQGFVDDLAQNNYSGWTQDLFPIHPNAANDTWTTLP